MNRGRRTFCLSLMLSLVIRTAAFAAETATTGTMKVMSADRTHMFDIEIADEPNERSRGLMHRETLPEDHGMLFIYPRDQRASFWMKNTLIPLDMLFISSDGRILQIARETTPFSLEPVRSRDPVRAVLEINGGLSDRLGIAAGDTVTLFREN